MRTLITTSIILFMTSFLFAQVGIGTTTPSSDLEVISKGTLASGEFNGIIIPKVTVLPTGADLPTASQTGLILYLDSNDAAEGFYFFNGTSYQNVNATSAFYTDGTTDNATSTTSEIVRTGRTSFGTESVAAAVVTIENAGASAGEDRIILSVNNRHTSTVGTSIALDIENTADTNADKIGIRNMLGVTGNGAHIGIDNTIAVRDSGTAANFGIRNVIGASTTSGQDINGISTTAGNAGATGTVYGIRSIALNDGSNNSFSGYFQGDSFAIKNAGDTDGYTMPVDSGEEGEVLTTDGTGTATWSKAANTVPVQYSLWQGGDYNVNNILTYSDLNGIQTIFDPSQIDSSNNVEIKLVIWVTDYAAQTDFELRAFDLDRNGTIPITQSDLIYENNASGGFITTNWIDYNAGTATPPNNNTFVQLILRAIIAPSGGFNPDAQIRSVYVLIRPNQ